MAGVTCEVCGQDYPVQDKYLIQHIDVLKDLNDPKAYFTMCKKCFIKNIADWFDYDNITESFKKINFPFIENLWHESISVTNARLLQANNIVGAITNVYSELPDKDVIILITVDEYFKRAGLPSNHDKFFNKGYTHSIILDGYSRNKSEKAIKATIQKFEQDKIERENIKLNEIKEEEKSKFLDEFGFFRADLLSDNDYIFLSRKWGLKYNNYELIKLEEYWVKAYKSFDIVTSTHQDLLIKIAKISLEIDKAVDKDEWAKVKELSKLMNELMTSANFTPKSKAGVVNKNFISSIGELVAYVEEQEGFIPRYNYKVNKDILDITIDNFNEYTRNLVQGEINLEQTVESALIKMESDVKKEDDDNIVEEVDEIDEDEFTTESTDEYYDATDATKFLQHLKQQKEE